MKVKEKATIKLKEAYYGLALEYYSKSEWQSAIECFTKLVSLDADYRDAAAKLEDAEKQIKLESLYAQGMDYFRREAWEEVIDRFAELVRLDADYKDAAARLKEARAKAGILVNKYKILRLLGSGAVGDVYLAKDIDLERKVAIKHLKSKYASDEEALERFQREARTIASLRHQNIAIVHGLEQEDGQSYIIMEYAGEGTLRRFLAEEGPLPIAQAIDLAIDLCRALAVVHRRGIIHRDIKPSNILLIESEEEITPRLSDFGLSSTSEGGFYLDTLQYASSEQLREEPVDARSDIYSLGMVLYEMLTGRPSFIGSKDEILRAQLEQEPPSLRSARRAILPSLEKVVLKALFKKPEDRYQTAWEMAEDLEIARQEQLEKQEEVRSLYAQAKQYISSEDWLMAVEMLEAVSSLDPNYEDTAQWLAKARKYWTLQTTYEQGLAASHRQEWGKAVKRFREILNIDEAYRDVADRLTEADKQRRLQSLYIEARQLEEMREWSEAIKKYAQIIADEPGYKDVADRLTKAGERDRLRLLYEEANVLFAEKNWQGAAGKFQEVLDVDPRYEDAASKAREADKHAQSQMRYAKGVEYLENREWGRAIAIFKKIQRSDRGYRDVDVKLAEAKRQKGWQDLYDKGMACHSRRDWQGAIKKFTQLLSENPEYPAAVMLLKEAKWRQTYETRGNPIQAWWSSQHSTMKAAWIGAAAVLLAALCGLLGGNTTLEIGRYILGMNRIPTPTVPAPTATSTSTLASIASPTATSTSTSTPAPSPTVTATSTSTPTPSPTATATSTSTPTPSPTLTSTPYPAPALVSPDVGTSFAKGQDVKLQWEWERDLAEDEFFEVRIRLKGEQEFERMSLTKVLYQVIATSELTQSGVYEWQVAIVSLSGEEKGVSQIRSFEVR